MQGQTRQGQTETREEWIGGGVGERANHVTGDPSKMRSRGLRADKIEKTRRRDERSGGQASRDTRASTTAKQAGVCQTNASIVVTEKNCQARNRDSERAYDQLQDTFTRTRHLVTSRTLPTDHHEQGPTEKGKGERTCQIWASRAGGTCFCDRRHALQGPVLLFDGSRSCRRARIVTWSPGEPRP